MKDWDFSFKGTKLSSFGCRLQSRPRRQRGRERIDTLTIPGRSGTLHVREGEEVFDPATLAMTINVPPGADRDGLMNWLRGSGALILGVDESRTTTAWVTSELICQEILAGTGWDTLPVTMELAPFWYLASPGSDITLTSSNTTITNPGTARALPLITVTGTGDATMSLGAQMITLSFGDSQSVIRMDSELREAMNSEGTASRNADMSGDFLYLPAGRSAILWTGEITKVVVKPRWRWI